MALPFRDPQPETVRDCSHNTATEVMAQSPRKRKEHMEQFLDSSFKLFSLQQQHHSHPLPQPIRIINHLCPLAHPARHPHGRVDKVVPRVARVHVDVQPELVRARVDVVGAERVVERLQHLGRAGAPAVRLDLDVGRRLVGRLEQVARVELGGEGGEDVLVVVASELDGGVSVLCIGGWERGGLPQWFRFPTWRSMFPL